MPRRSAGPLRVTSLQCSSGFDAVYSVGTDWSHALHRRMDFLVSKMTTDDEEDPIPIPLLLDRTDIVPYKYTKVSVCYRISNFKSEAESIFFQDEAADVHEFNTGGGGAIVKVTSPEFAPRHGTPLASAVCGAVVFLFYQGADNCIYSVARNDFDQSWGKPNLVHDALSAKANSLSAFQWSDGSSNFVGVALSPYLDEVKIYTTRVPPGIASAAWVFNVSAQLHIPWLSGGVVAVCRVRYPPESGDLVDKYCVFGRNSDDSVSISGGWAGPEGGQIEEASVEEVEDVEYIDFPGRDSVISIGLVDVPRLKEVQVAYSTAQGVLFHRVLLYPDEVEEPILEPLSPLYSPKLISPTPSLPASPIFSPSSSPLQSPIPSPVPFLERTPVPSPVLSPLASPIPSPVPSPTSTPLTSAASSRSVSLVPSPVQSPYTSPAPSRLPTPTPFDDRSRVPSLVPSPFISPSPSPVPTRAPTPTPDADLSRSSSPVPSPWASPSPSPVPSPVQSIAPSPVSRVVSPLPSPSPSPSPSPVSERIPSPLPFPDPSPVPSPLPSPFVSPSPSPLPSRVSSPVLGHEHSPPPSTVPSPLVSSPASPKPSPVSLSPFTESPLSSPITSPTIPAPEVRQPLGGIILELSEVKTLLELLRPDTEDVGRSLSSRFSSLYEKMLVAEFAKSPVVWEPKTVQYLGHEPTVDNTGLDERSGLQSPPQGQLPNSFSSLNL